MDCVAGNVLNCDCFVRPLRRHFDQQTFLEEFYKEIQCDGPPYLSGKYLYTIPNDRLNCPSNVNISRIMERQPGEYDVTTDYKIREIHM